MPEIKRATELSEQDMLMLQGTDTAMELINNKLEVRFSASDMPNWDDILEWLRDNANFKWHQSTVRSPYTVVNGKSILFGWLYFEDDTDAIAFKIKWT